MSKAHYHPLIRQSHWLFSYSFLFFVATVLSSIQGNCLEKEGIGFGWDEVSQQEKIYNVDLTSGEVTEIGTIPDLQFLALGSYDFDATTGAAVVLGYLDDSDTGRIFAIDTLTRTALSFEIPAIDNTVFQDTVINPKNGEIYAIAYNSADQENKIYRAYLNPGSTSGDAATAELQLVTTFTVMGYAAGSTSIGKSGKLSFLEVGDGFQRLSTIDISTLESSNLEIDGELQTTVACPKSSDAEEFFGIGYRASPGENFFAALNSDGTLTELGATSLFSSWSAGSQVCASADLILLATPSEESEESEGGAALYSIPLDGGEVTQLILDATNLKIVYPYKKSENSDSLSKKNLIRAAGNIKVVSAENLGNCAKKFKSIRKAHSFRKLIKAARKLKFKGKSCKARS